MSKVIVAKNADEHSVSLTGLVLGYLGLIPFLSGALLVLLVDPIPRFLNQIFILYSVIILSFLGGTQWGLALAFGRKRAGRFILSVVPSVVSWFVYLVYTYLPDMTLLFVLCFLGLSHLVQLSIDKKIFLYVSVPTWYNKMRPKLAYTVSICHLFMILPLLR